MIHLRLAACHRDTLRLLWVGAVNVEITSSLLSAHFLLTSDDWLPSCPPGGATYGERQLLCAAGTFASQQKLWIGFTEFALPAKVKGDPEVTSCLCPRRRVRTNDSNVHTPLYFCLYEDLIIHNPAIPPDL